MIKKTWLLLTLLLVASPSLAADFYIAQSAAGSEDGSSCANADAATWFNTSDNWANPKEAGKVGPGDTVHLCGTISTALEVQASGSSGAVITILFESGAKLSKNTWGDGGYAIQAYVKDYITIDGGATGIIGGYGATGTVNGIIEATDNGTALTYQDRFVGINGASASHLTVKNLAIKNMYVRTRGTDEAPGGGSVDPAGIRNMPSNGAITDFDVYNVVIHDASVGVHSSTAPGCSGYDFSYLTIYNVNWGVAAGSRGNASDSLTGSSVYNSWFYNWTNWDDTDGNAFHHNGVFFPADSGTITSIEIYSNRFGPGWGGEYQTSGIYINTGIVTPLLYNNVFIADTDEACANGFITADSNLNTTLHIYNNTFIGAGGANGTAIKLSGNAQAQTINVKNNLVKGPLTAISLSYRTNVTLNSDYNSFYDLPASLAFLYSTDSSGVYKTLAEWLALGYDAHSVLTDPKVTSTTDGHLLSDSLNIGVGAVLTSYFLDDADGVTRGAAWDIGAFEYVPTGTQVYGIRSTSGTVWGPGN